MGDGEGVGTPAAQVDGMADGTGQPREILPSDAPADLKAAERELRTANGEFVTLLHQVTLWRVMAYDREPPERLGRSYAAQGFLTARSALLNGIVLSISRLFDGTGSSLDLNRTFNRILRPPNAAWLREWRSASFRDLPMVDQDGKPWPDAVWAVLEHMAEQDGAKAAKAFDEELEAFRQAKKRFTSGDVADALGRLQELRNKEIAHTDLEPAWATARPKLADLDAVFDALQDMLARANRLCTGLDTNTEAFAQGAGLAARCFAAAFRRETLDERRAAAEATKHDKATAAP